MRDENVNMDEIQNDQLIGLVWTQPRIVYKYLKTHNCKKLVRTLLVLAGITEGVYSSLGNNLSLLLILLLVIPIWGAFGWISFYITSAFLRWTGSWFNGKADTDQILRMFSFAMIPTILTLLLMVFKVVMFENELFQSNFNINDYSVIAQVIYYSLEVIEYILSAWTLLLLIIGISEMHDISIGKSILSLILPIVIFGSLIISIIYLIS